MPKNKQTLYAVLRHDFSGVDVLVAVCRSPEKADDLQGEYSQLFTDRGISPDESYFYTTGVIYYDS
jgi:hypothetical protein